MEDTSEVHSEENKGSSEKYEKRMLKTPDTSEVHSEENKGSSEKYGKRTLKTPAQVFALENFYDDNRYPTEEMKLQLAEQTGLTKRQVSGWFCHRRLKDKRLVKDEVYANGKQDRSSAVLQDRGSGLRQDSCGSTKQGEYRHVDPREVESQRFYGQEFAAIDHGNNHLSGNDDGLDDTCSQSTSASQDKFYPQNLGLYDFKISRCVTENGASIPAIAKGANKMPHRPSGFLKVKGDIENAAITAVKRQLGRQYRDDGPPLGVEFQPIPPGAFESPIENPIPEPYASRIPALRHSPDVSRVQQQPNLTNRSGVYKSKLSYQDLRMEGTCFGTMDGSTRYENKPHSQFMQKSSFLTNNIFPGRNSSLDIHEDFAGDASVYNCKRDDMMIFKHGKGRPRSDSVSDQHLSPLDRELVNERTDCGLHKYNTVSLKAIQRNKYLKDKPSNLVVNHSESVDTEEREPSRGMTKDEQFYGERKTSNVYNDPVSIKRHQKNKMVDGKRARVEFTQRDYVTTTSLIERSSGPSQTKGAMEKPSSFNEDETAETSSSLD